MCHGGLECADTGEMVTSNDYDDRSRWRGVGAGRPLVAEASSPARAWSSMVPASAGSDRGSGPAKFPCQGALMHRELARHDRERRALLIAFGGQGDAVVAHLSDVTSTSDPCLVEVVDHRRSMDLISTGERVNRRTASIEDDQCIDLGRGQSSLHRV